MPTFRRSRREQQHDAAVEQQGPTAAPLRTTNPPGAVVGERMMTTSTSKRRQNRTRRRDAAAPTTMLSEVELTTTALRRSMGSHSKSKSRLSSSSSKQSMSSSISNRNENRAQRYWKFLGVRPATWQATGILVVAMATSLLWNVYEQRHHNVDPTVQQFLQHFCAASYCHRGLVPSRRTQRTVRVLLPGQKLLQIPRHYTLWDLDALRDDWIQEELFFARRDGTQYSNSNGSGNHTKPLPSRESAAYLAVYLARLLKQIASWEDRGVNQTQSEHHVLEDPILREYLSILPSSRDDFDFHPVLWSESDLELLGTNSLTFDYVTTQRNRMRDEYETFSAASINFSAQTTWYDYQVARLLVMTRSFGTGPLQANEAAGYIPLDDELAFYQKSAGVDLSKGSHAMVPVLDLYDHHAKPNVGFTYDSEKRAFVVSAIAAIPSGREIFDSYGKRTDPDLFAKYGFINGDGSEYTEASLALWHSLGDNPKADDKPDYEKRTRKQILRYLQYDDGYDSCVQQHGPGSVADEVEAANPAWVLKGLKFEYLLMHAHDTTRWVVRMPPRDPLSTPAASSSIPISLQPPEFDMRSLQFDGRLAFSTCRLISLTHHDYNGTAVELLQSNLNNASFYLPPTRDALEFRTLLCAARMAQTALAKFGVSLSEQLDLVASLNRNHTAFHSRDWTVAHLRLGEMQTLEALKQTAYAGLRPFHDKIDTEPGFSMRNDPCPPHLLLPLLTGQSSKN